MMPYFSRLNLVKAYVLCYYFWEEKYNQENTYVWTFEMVDHQI